MKAASQALPIVVGTKFRPDGSAHHPAIGLNESAARANWGAKLPEWILALAEECDREGRSQGGVGAALGVSGSMINQVLHNAYKGRLDRIEALVRGEFMRAVLACPILGEISTRDCMDHQHRKYAPTNPLRVKLHRACRTCPNRREA